MPSISTVVSVQIDRQTKGIQNAAFGLPMFLGLHKAFPERVRFYQTLESVAEDFSTTSKEYKAAQSFFGQSISVAEIAIGRQASGDAVTFTPTVANNTAYTVVINGTTFSFTSDASALATEIVTGLTSAINAGSEPVTASGVSTLILTADVSGVPFSVQFSDNLTPAYTASESLTAALTACALENNDWYGLHCYSHVKADILEVAAYAEAAKKLYGTSSSDSDILSSPGTDTTSVAKALLDAGYERTYLLYSAVANTVYPECAWAGKELARSPGTSTWKFKTLAGVTVDSLTDTQYENALAKNCNVYVRIGGQNITVEGFVSGGEFIDTMRNIDYLVNQIQIDQYSRFVNLPKIPFTQSGISIVENELRGTIQRATVDGILADDTAVEYTIPKIKDISANDRANRILRGVKFKARIAGAIHKEFIEGIVFA